MIKYANYGKIRKFSDMQLSTGGIAKLGLLNFWYDALRNHDKDPEFWTDLLYFGLKITAKGDFGPHAKIS